MGHGDVWLNIRYAQNCQNVSTAKKLISIDITLRMSGICGGAWKNPNAPTGLVFLTDPHLFVSVSYTPVPHPTPTFLQELS